MTEPGESLATAAGLPGLDCGGCGQKSCAEFARRLRDRPEERVRCIYLDGRPTGPARDAGRAAALACGAGDRGDLVEGPITWKDSLGRDFDFVLETFAHEPGPRETILPHNPQVTRELDVRVGDILIGRPMGMSCGCPITHCGVAMDVDARSGVIVWCVTGPLQPRSTPPKDLGYYSAQAYEGLVRASKAPLEIGMRYWFMPRRCMLQWRHSGLVNALRRRPDGAEVRVEGLMIG